MSYRTDKLGDGRTDGQTQATTIPEGQNWPRVKRHSKLPKIMQIAWSCFLLRTPFIWWFCWSVIKNIYYKIAFFVISVPIIFADFPTWPYSITLVVYIKAFIDEFIRFWIRTKWNFHRVWITMENPWWNGFLYSCLWWVFSAPDKQPHQDTAITP